ncbi:MAG: DUF6036 family nucleotidyltransferase [Acidimicrobiales bacterium]
MEQDRLEDALETLGELLAERGQEVGLLVIGGSSLLLLGYIDRPTADVDVVGLAAPAGYAKAEELPQFLRDAVGEVGRALGIGDRWLNAGPAGLLDFGLPQGTAGRVTVLRYGSLEIHLPAREDLVCFKLYALVDQGPRSKHMGDRRALTPSRDELLTAARWTRTHDPSVGFLDELRGALALFDVEVGDDDL